jgi:hypothetical protein
MFLDLGLLKIEAASLSSVCSSTSVNFLGVGLAQSIPVSPAQMMGNQRRQVDEPGGVFSHTSFFPPHFSERLSDFLC